MSEHQKKPGAPGIFGECKQCWCLNYTLSKPAPPQSTDFGDYSGLKPGAPIIEWILERFERKGCPQGLNVMAEELQWMGQGSITREKLLHAIHTEMRQRHPRIQLVSENVYWLAGKNVPAGWSVFGDKRMLPCFYREYPPHVSWDELDRPENILPPPQRQPSR